MYWDLVCPHNEALSLDVNLLDISTTHKLEISILTEGSYLDANLTWYTEDPDLTPCFQKTVLIWLPCALLWGLSPLEAYYILGSRTRDITWNSLNVTKLVITSSLIFLCASDLGFEISRGSQGFDVFSADYLAPLVKMASLGLAAGLQYYNRAKGIRTSGILFLFWLLSALCGLVQFRHLMRKSQYQEHGESSYHLVSYVLCYTATLAQLVLTFFVDTPPKKCKHETIQPHKTVLLSTPTNSTVLYANHTHSSYALLSPMNSSRTGPDNRDSCILENVTHSSQMIATAASRFDKFIVVTDTFELSRAGERTRVVRYVRAGEMSELNPSPFFEASFPSRLYFQWFDRFVCKGYRQPVTRSDLWGLNPEDTSKEVVPLFDKHWKQTLSKVHRKGELGTKFHSSSGSVDLVNSSPRPRYPSILPALCRAYGLTFLFGCALLVCVNLLTFVSPQILRNLIVLVSGDDSLWKGYLYAATLIIVASIQTAFNSQYTYKMMVVAIRVRMALISVIYRKALCMSNKTRKESTVGEIVNLMSVDAARIFDAIPNLNIIWSAPFQIGLALYFLWEYMGPAVLAGLTVMLILIPVNGFIAKKLKALQICQMKTKDQRIRLMNEVLNGIKVLKLYAWEPPYEKVLQGMREKEIGILTKQAYLSAVTSSIWVGVPVLVSLLTFMTYILMDQNNELTAQTAFVSLTLFNIMRGPLALLPLVIGTMIQANVSLNRINSYLASEELDKNSVSHEISEQYPLVIENGSFSWGRGDDPFLRNINVTVKEGALLAVVGTVGSGKTSLISAFLGEMDKLSGRVNTKGSIAYVPQQAWIQQATIQDNIMFGKPLDKMKYFKVIEACALRNDLQILPGGDQTEIGEKGINLSGGQKQRVSLARAVYRDTEVYLLDDPLSAVDSHVGKHIFENVIGPSGLLKHKVSWLENVIGPSGLLKHKVSWLENVIGPTGLLKHKVSWLENVIGPSGLLKHKVSWVENVIGPSGLLKHKTRVLVTHSITYLPKVDMILVLKDGKVLERGTYRELVQSRGAFADFLDQHLQEIVAHNHTLHSQMIGNVYEVSNLYLVELEEVKQQLESSLGREQFQRTFSRALSQMSQTRSISDSLEDLRSKAGSMMSSTSERFEGSLHLTDGVTYEGFNSTTSGVTYERFNSTASSKQAFGSRWQEDKEETNRRFSLDKGRKLIKDELAQIGNVDWAVYKYYIEAITIAFAIATVSCNAVQQCFYALSNMWLTVWSTNGYGLVNETTNVTIYSPQDLYLGLYGFLGSMQVIGAVLATLATSIGSVKASKYLHNSLLRNVLRLPQTLFDTTPTGRILNRFSLDINVLDDTFPMVLRICVPQIFRRVFVSTMRQVKRIESISRAPIFSHFEETITGAQTIRAYGMQEKFIEESETRVDINQMAVFPGAACGSWLSVRLELIGGLITFFAALFAVLSRDTVDPALVGLSISSSLQVEAEARYTGLNSPPGARQISCTPCDKIVFRFRSFPQPRGPSQPPSRNDLVLLPSPFPTVLLATVTIALTVLMRTASDVETNIVAVERIKEYVELQQEAPWEQPSHPVPSDWPTMGEVTFQDYQLRYREGLDLVLKGVSFSIRGGEKVGIVGRTGAGKSSLTLALFRIIEPAGGSILIDDVDISQLGLHALRSRITIIPQDPVLFSGSLRQNLDPHRRLTDEVLWRALEHAHLKDYVGGLLEGLNHDVAEGGENFSVGQRQLICLARALLRKTRVLVLDEVTAAVDLGTDNLIQETIRREFADSTVLTIAHRLNTILDSDRVIVLDKGRVVEFNSPEVLLQDNRSVFYEWPETQDYSRNQRRKLGALEMFYSMSKNEGLRLFYSMAKNEGLRVFYSMAKNEGLRVFYSMAKNEWIVAFYSMAENEGLAMF
uniref:ABC-type glutathione-S-conjugate transporter n=1 Tax=Timema monikensis TaxID=170555 RepID=A0A7R9HMG9_9NEOP|nr:unnamed protein product [Timema monikensis]